MKVDVSNIFYKNMGDTNWRCKYCGHAYNPEEIRNIIKEKMNVIDGVREIIRNSFGGEDEPVCEKPHPVSLEKLPHRD